MSGNTIRREAISDIINQDPVATTIPFAKVPTSDIFGLNVFSLAVMKKRLPKDVYKSLKYTIETGSKLDASTADDTPPYPARFWVDLDADRAGWEQTDDLGGDFARVNDALTGVRSRFHYMSAVLATERRLGDFDSIVRYDDATQDRQIWNAGPTGHVGESVFASDPEGSAEDDGWLLNAVYDAASDRTDLCVLDAHDVAAGPLARVHVPRRIPFGFHANWFAAG